MSNAEVAEGEAERMFAEIEGLRSQLALLDQANSTLSGQNTDLADQVERLRVELSRMEDADAQGNRRTVELEDEVDRLRAVIEPVVAYHRMYMAGGNGGCINPVSSGSHEDHDCLVSLHARMLAAVGELARQKDR